jgi:hypothetical protein
MMKQGDNRRMRRNTKTGLKGRLAAGIAGAAIVFAVPTASLAIGLIDDDAGQDSLSRIVAFTPADADPGMLDMIESRGGMARMKRFTPAGITQSDDRSVTVAVRVDGDAAQAITVRNAIAAADAPAAAALTRLTPTRYNLGVARGYSRFAQASSIPQQPVSAAIPDMSQFELSTAKRDEPSRFAARIALEEESRAAPAAPQSLDSITDQRLDVAGSYRLSRNLDVRAGVRFEQDRNRLAALPDIDQQDSQAVYIGTQFRF